MRTLLPWALVSVAAFGAPPEYRLNGHVQPQGEASVTLFGATTPFREVTMSDAAGKFTFKKVAAGTYTVSVFFKMRGEARQTVEVGPASADSRHRVRVDLDFKEADFQFADAARRRNSVSARQLAIPEKAQRDYGDAGKELARRNAAGAVKKLEHAVELAPQFAAAWNELGVIAYQTRQFDRAEQCFRQSLDADPRLFEPLVNLGGVLVTLRRTAEALEYNQRALRERPDDALANSQLGQAYLQTGDYNQALRYLEHARQIDPSHFSHPQLFLAEIHVRLGQREDAIAELEDFLKHHPDWPAAGAIRHDIAKLRQ